MVRRSLEDIVASRPALDRVKVGATTEEDIRRHAAEDGPRPDTTPPADAALVVPPRAVREKLGMTQAEFARALRIPVATLRNWEQQRVRLDPAVRSLLTIVYRNPDALKALAS